MISSIVWLHLEASISSEKTHIPVVYTHANRAMLVVQPNYNGAAC
jgi:hypothetical protein